jgi:hypothetical protein
LDESEGDDKEEEVAEEEAPQVDKKKALLVDFKFAMLLLIKFLKGFQMGRRVMHRTRARRICPSPILSNDRNASTRESSRSTTKLSGKSRGSSWEKLLLKPDRRILCWRKFYSLIVLKDQVKISKTSQLLSIHVLLCSTCDN